ncbi:MAG: hypothetical protein H0W42_02970 [Gemmatimonadaceae bacterium]|nr:hypothetical protein [Gemmatimonadaceae bacterium]
MIQTARPYPGFIGASHVSQAQQASQERTINLFPEVQATEFGKNQAILIGTPGVTTWATLPTSPIRGSFEEQGRYFVAAGDTLYEVFSNTSAVPRGTLAYTDGVPVDFAGSGLAGGQLLIRASRNAYVLSLDTNVLTLVRTGNTDAIGYLGGYFLALDATATKFEWSELFDGTVWPALNFYVRTNRSDPWVTMHVMDERVVLLGSETSDTYWAGGVYPNIFQPLPGGTFETGIAASHSVATVGGARVWLAQSGDGLQGVVRSSGTAVENISHHALQHAIAGYARVDDAIGQSYQHEGHTFYLLTFPSARVTWAWDVAVPGVWCERGTWIAEDADYDYWHPTYHQQMFGLHLAGDRESGTIYRVSSQFFLDVGGRPIRRVRRAPALSHNGRRIYYSYFALQVDAGVAPLGVTPLVELRVSDNSGKTFQSLGTRSAGKQGEFDAVCEWYGLGHATDRVFEAVTAAAGPVRWINALMATRNAA